MDQKEESSYPDLRQLDNVILDIKEGKKTPGGRNTVLTPTTKSRIIGLREKKEEFKEKKIWKSCCFTINKDFFKFTIQCSVCIMILLFCMFKLLLDGNSPDKAVYYSLISGILGLFSPSPAYSKGKNDEQQEQQ